jgi:hypothetical protein
MKKIAYRRTEATPIRNIPEYVWLWKVNDKPKMANDAEMKIEPAMSDT